ncbi:tail protein X [Aurantimonas sp. MSK8Z-1]|uniref:tail protein X n=1 Tax=Mangrovibrevibacter kandeliae TaxID=2968473 RepID=UPI0021179353|nr:tail protein X [Aurantimonas sp. MSK8Z-1]MCW4114730.1 tail protein X [Aurantimonas sp. MSK8Z-1]
MSEPYRTRQGEMLDAICRARYGDESGYVERVLEANPGLADLGPVLPIGTLLTLPDLTDVTRRVELVTLGFSS